MTHLRPEGDMTMLASDEEDVSWYAEKVASTENNFEGFLIQVLESG